MNAEPTRSSGGGALGESLAAEESRQTPANHQPSGARSYRLIVFAVIAMVAAALMALGLWFPRLRESYFALNERSLQQVPSGLLVLRPTRFAHSHFNGVVSTRVVSARKPRLRLIGRNVSFKDLMAAAYAAPADRVVLPADAPQTNFDFLVTVRRDPHEPLQRVIRQQLGFVGSVEQHEANVLALKVEDPNLPGLTISDANSSPGVHFHDGKLWFTHVRLGALTGTIEQTFGLAVVDRTGLSNFYDFSIAWNVELQRQLQKGDTARTIVKQVLNSFGLALIPETTSVQVLTVKRQK